LAAESVAEPAEDLQSKRERENSQAEDHRRRRDELNERTRGWADRRDTLNGEVRRLVEEAVTHREKRDTLNAEVREAKKVRDSLNRKVIEFTEKLNNMKRRRLPRGAVPVGKLRRELKALEFKQQTSVLSVNKERAIIDEMQRIRGQLDKIEKAFESDTEVSGVKTELAEAKEAAETAHASVGELAEKAQAEHDTMAGLYEQSDVKRREADKAQEDFIRTKMQADAEHKKHIEHIRQVHDLDKLIHGYSLRARKASPAVISQQKEAEMIFERFKKGEKLSTEDLMTLQKSGYL
jgi:uncharacterized coiled-coil DUF342 family protein